MNHSRMCRLVHGSSHESPQYPARASGCGVRSSHFSRLSITSVSHVSSASTVQWSSRCFVSAVAACLRCSFASSARLNAWARTLMSLMRWRVATSLRRLSVKFMMVPFGFCVSYSSFLSDSPASSMAMSMASHAFSQADSAMVVEDPGSVHGFSCSTTASTFSSVSALPYSRRRSRT